MNDPRRPERFSPPQPGSEPTDPRGRWQPPPVDPAYADQAPFAPTYGGPYVPWTTGFNEADPTTRLPAYWQYDQPPPGEVPPELERCQAWALHGQREALCPSQHNDGAVIRCQWPARLRLEVTATGGSFEQRWLMFADGC